MKNKKDCVCAVCGKRFKLEDNCYGDPNMCVDCCYEEGIFRMSEQEWLSQK